MRTFALNEVATIHGGGRLGLTGEDFVDYGFPAFGAGGQNGYVSVAEYERPGIVLSSIGARCGKCFYVEGPWSTLANTQVILPRSEIVDARFLWYQLNDESSWPRSGSAQPFIKPSDVKRRVVSLPSLMEQRRIAAILDQADVLRAKSRQVLAHLDTLVQAIWSVATSDATRAVPLGDLIVGGPTNGLYRPASDYGSGTRILRIDGFGRNGMLDSEWKRVRLGDVERARYALSVGDIVINRVNALSHLGKSVLIEHLAEESVYESNMMRLRIDESLARPKFVVQALRSDSVRQQILRRAKKAINQASINQADVRGLVIQLPSLRAQWEFESRVKAVAFSHTQIGNAMACYQELFASLQTRAFRGELS